MARRRRPERNRAEPERNRKASGTPKDRTEFRCTGAELPSGLPSSADVPNYIPKILAAKAKRGVALAVVFHDDWCAIFKGRTCDCNPDVEIRGEGDATH